MKRRVSTLTRAAGGVYKDITNKQYVVKLKEQRAYLLEGSDEKKYMLFQNRFFVLLFGSALLTYFINLKIGLIVGVVAYLAIEAYFRLVFIKKLDEYVYDEILDESTQNNIFAKFDTTRLIVALVIHIALIACLIINFMQTIYVIPINEWETTQIYIVIGSAILMFFCIYNITRIAAGFRANQIVKK